MTPVNLSKKQKQTHRLREETCGCQGGEGIGGGLDWEFGTSRCKPLYIEWINKVLLYSTGNYIQYPVINLNGKEYEKEYIYIYIYIYKTESLCYTPETNITL